MYYQTKAAEHSVHPTLGILARFQAFFQSDSVPPPTPARVTQTVGRLTPKSKCKTVFAPQSFVIGCV
jgi:hypothetical protein